MKLQDQVCTLEQGVKLFNYGISLSHFVHVTTKVGRYVGVMPADDEGISLYKEIIIPAFNTSELLLMNGEMITLNDAQLSQSAMHLAYHLIGRLESGEITPDEVNARLQ